MQYLLLATLSIIVYAEVLPTISIFFELIRTWIACKIAIIQQYTLHTQEDIQDTQARMEPTKQHRIGFDITRQEEYINEDEDYED